MTKAQIVLFRVRFALQRQIGKSKKNEIWIGLNRKDLSDDKAAKLFTSSLK